LLNALLDDYLARWEWDEPEEDAGSETPEAVEPEEVPVG